MDEEAHMYMKIMMSLNFKGGYMAEKGLITKSTLADIGQAIRDKSDTLSMIKPAGMAQKIKDIHALALLELPNRTFHAVYKVLADTQEPPAGSCELWIKKETNNG